MNASPDTSEARPFVRDVDARLTMYRLFGAPRAGLCAGAVRAALAAPYQGFPHATAVGLAVPRGAMHRYNAPRGSMAYWRGGRHGYGHVCFALGDHTLLSVDTSLRGPGVASVVPYSWFGEHWPDLTYVGWSWHFGRIDTAPISQGD